MNSLKEIIASNQPLSSNKQEQTKWIKKQQIRFRLLKKRQVYLGFLDETTRVYSNGQTSYSLKQLMIICDYIFKSSPNKEILMSKMEALFIQRFKMKFEEIVATKVYSWFSTNEDSF